MSLVSPACSSPLFFLASPLPPSSTLFPYTTLFRSTGIGCYWLCGCDPQPHYTQKLLSLFDSCAHSARARRFFHQFWRDRKSTRLNSSHQIISYAVFCLKKKKV